MDTARNKHVVRGLVRASIRQKVDGRSLEVCAIGHASHWWFGGHDVPKVWHFVAQV
jgi:hypothetical protein